MAEFFTQDFLNYSYDEDSYFPFNKPCKPCRKQSLIGVEYETYSQLENSSEDDQNKPTICIAQENYVNQTTPQFIVGDIQTNKIHSNSRKIKKEIYMLPGESKNIPKNFIRAFKEFIYHNIESSKRTCPMNKFLALKPEKACKQTLLNILKDIKMKQLAQQFFGQFRWASIFLAENKVSLEQYFRFNNLYFQRKNFEEVIED